MCANERNQISWI